VSFLDSGAGEIQPLEPLSCYNSAEVVTTFSSFRFPELSQPI
jgi:hypothetical protein